MASNRQMSPYRREKGLVAHYPFAHADARDITGNGNDGTLNGDASVSGGAVSQDGTGDYVELTTDCFQSGTMQGDHTFSAWVKSDNPGNIDRVVGYRKDGTYSVYVLFLAPTTFEFTIFIREDQTSAPSSVYAVGSTSCSTGVWYHVAATWVYNSGSPTVRLYVNGSQEATDSTTGFGFTSGVDSETSLGGLMVGGVIQSGTEWDGDIGSTRFYDRALSATEISQLYQNERGDYA